MKNPMVPCVFVAAFFTSLLLPSAGFSQENLPPILQKLNGDSTPLTDQEMAEVEGEAAFIPWAAYAAYGYAVARVVPAVTKVGNYVLKNPVDVPRKLEKGYSAIQKYTASKKSPVKTSKVYYTNTSSASKSLLKR